MNAKRGVIVALMVAVLAAALVLLRGRQPRGVEAARREASVAASDVERPRRARATRPRPAAHETREASVAAPETTAPAAAAKLPVAVADTTPASAQGASPRADQLSTTVLQAAVRGDWIVLDEHDTPCKPQNLRIVYQAPSDLGGYQKGAYFEPLGPGPGDGDSEVNGLLLCEGSTFLYRGFEAYYRADRGQWDVFPFPVIE